MVIRDLKRKYMINIQKRPGFKNIKFKKII